MVLWYCGTVGLWYCGTVVLWYCGTVVRYEERTLRLFSKINNLTYILSRDKDIN